MSNPYLVGHGPHHVIVVHGWFGSASAWEPFAHVVDGERFTYAFLDCRGYGDRKAHPGPFTMEAIAEDVIALADALGWSQFHLMGHSMGGKISMLLALRHPELVERLLDVKLLSTLSTPTPMEQALALCMEQGQLRRHAERLRQHLDKARTRSVALAQAAGCHFVSEPAGMFGWVDTGVNTEVLTQRLLDEGYMIAPGAMFHASRASSTCMRINFATTQDAVFWRVFERVVGRMRELG